MKTGLWLRGGRGKFAGATVYKDSASGETVMREVVTPANPKTEKQLIQRIVMATVGQSLSLLKDIVDHSFEGMKKGRESIAYYNSQNVQVLRAKIQARQEEGAIFDEIKAFNKLGEKGFSLNRYQIAMGSLPQVTTTIDEDSIYAVAPQIVGATYGDIIDALGLKRGDQLTFCIVGSADITRNVEFKYARVILDPTNADGSSAPLTTPFIVDGSINLPSRRNEGELTLTADAEGLQFKYRNFFTWGAGVIVSRQVGDKWLRSTAYLEVADDDSFPGNTLYEALEAAKRGVVNEIYTGNEIYLNNAGVTSVSASENTGGDGGNSGGGLPGGGGGSESGNSGGGLPGGGGAEGQG